MSEAVTKTFSLLLLIGIGYVLQRKLQSRDHREGIKTMILSLALPATIFVALLQIDFKSNLIIIPVLSLGFNVVMHFLVDKLPLRPLLNMPLNQYRTLIMLIPSLAPGLSCFPFIMEYSGQGPLAMAALADVGNKIFVLIISYTIAMKWYYEVNKAQVTDGKTKIKELLVAMLNEPVNLVILTALLMLALGLNYASLPAMITLSVDRLSLMMTPLILLFIGLSIKLTWEQVKTILAFLSFRSGVAFFLSGLVLYFWPAPDTATALLIIVFPQSACSFWPFAHMAVVGQMESKRGGSVKTFDQEFAMNVLACSMPLSVMMILLVYSSGDFFARTPVVFASSGLLTLLAGLIVILTSRSFTLFSRKAIEMASDLEKMEKASPDISR